MVTWIKKPIGKLFEFKNGLNKGKEYFGRGTPIINYMDVYKKDGVYGYELRGRVDLTAQEITRFEVRKGDVFFTRTSETPEEVGITCVLLDDVEDGVFSGFILRGRPITDELDINYCKYCFQTAYVRSEIVNSCTYTTRALTNGTQLSKIIIPVPPFPEQRAIAAALSDVDGYIAALERLIAKKRNIKKGAMQELLTGKRRLPEFRGEWIEKTVRDFATLVTKGTTPTSIGMPFISCGITFVKIESIVNTIIDPKLCAFIDVDTHKALARSILQEDDILISIAGALGRTAKVNKEILPANTNQALAIIRLEKEMVCGNYVFKYLQSNAIARHIAEINVQGAQANLSLENVNDLPLRMPPTIAEQTAIAAVLSDMDAEIDALTVTLNKVRNIKLGMMQELLTGRIRLVTETEEAKAAPAAKPAAKVSKLPKRKPEVATTQASGHNKAIEDAVILAVVADLYSTEQYPLAPFYSQKLPYLLHRHMEGLVEGYIKKAAGPYNPTLKYKTALPIALKNRYIVAHEATYKGHSFVNLTIGEKIAEAKTYFNQWHGDEPLQWLEQFRYIKNRRDELELLTTTDKAMVELRDEGETVTLQAVKGIIKKSSEWKDKLKRAIFSDDNISRAIRWSNELFGTGVDQQ
jgi:Restriction endonuclease S subunits